MLSRVPWHRGKNSQVENEFHILIITEHPIPLLMRYFPAKHCSIRETQAEFLVYLFEFLLEYSCSSMLYFLLFSKVDQLHTHT